MYKSATATPDIGGLEILSFVDVIDLERIWPMTIIDQIAMAKNRSGNQIGRSPDSMRSSCSNNDENLIINGLAIRLNNAPVPNNAINERIKSS